MGPVLAPVRSQCFGPFRHIYAYVDGSARCEVNEFLDALLEREETMATAASYLSLFRRHATEAVSPRGDRWHTLDDVDDKLEGLREYKHRPSKTRIISLADDDRLVVLLSVVTGKKEDKLPKGELQRAVHLRDEFRRRKAECLRTAGLRKAGARK